MIKEIHGIPIQIDEEDDDLLDIYCWQHNAKTNYIHRTDPIEGTIYLHREIMGFPQGFVVDHWNHDETDNRRENLRVCTQSENLLNSGPRLGKKYKGVSENRYGRFITRFQGIYHGSFATPEEAALKYNQVVQDQGHHHAYLNQVELPTED